MKKQTTWKRRNGKIIPINKLTDTHILNIVTLLGRTIDKDVPKLFPPYKVLLNEAIKRGLLGVLK